MDEEAMNAEAMNAQAEAMNAEANADAEEAMNAQEEAMNAEAANLCRVLDNSLDCKWPRIRADSLTLLLKYNTDIGCMEKIHILETELDEIRVIVVGCQSEIEGYKKQEKWAKKVRKKENKLIVCTDEKDGSELMAKIEGYKRKLELAQSDEDIQVKAEYSSKLKMEKRMMRRWKLGDGNEEEQEYHQMRINQYKDLLSQFEMNEHEIGKRLMNKLSLYYQYNQRLGCIEDDLAAENANHLLIMGQINELKMDLVRRMALNCREKWATFLGSGDVAALVYMIRFFDQNLLLGIDLVFTVGKTANRTSITNVRRILEPYFGDQCFPSLASSSLYRLSSHGRKLRLVELNASQKRDLNFKL